MARYSTIGAGPRGGLGSVVFYRDHNLDRKVAVKFIERGGEHRRLLDELAALQRIRSKHVVEIFDVLYVDGGVRMGIVEDYIDGQTLKPLLGKVPPNDEFIRLLYQVATGISDVHAVKIVHRDIKPSNMLLDHEGILKIIDFNLARSIDDAETHGFMGTRGYAAPELYDGGRVRFDQKVDVYALGICAWALLHGEDLPSPLMAAPPAPTQWQSTGGGFVSSGTGLDATLLALLDRCISQDPVKRPSAREVSHRSGQLLLRGRHRARFVVNGGVEEFELNKSRSRVTLQHPSLGSVTIAYDGLDFRVAAVQGEVWINNMRLAPGSTLPECCVIGFGSPSLRARERSFTTMDVSHPEVVL
jgi:serine/threonine-protein kinase